MEIITSGNIRGWNTVGSIHCFILRPVTFHKSALTRQVAEAVRIRRRRGEGSILNSRSEFNRCHIPRLQLEEQEPEDEIIRREQEERDRITRELEDNLTTCELRRQPPKPEKLRRPGKGEELRNVRGSRSSRMTGEQRKEGSTN